MVKVPHYADCGDQLRLYAEVTAESYTGLRVAWVLWIVQQKRVVLAYRKTLSHGLDSTTLTHQSNTTCTTQQACAAKFILYPEISNIIKVIRVRNRWYSTGSSCCSRFREACCKFRNRWYSTGSSCCSRFREACCKFRSFCRVNQFCASAEGVWGWVSWKNRVTGSDSLSETQITEKVSNT